LQSLRFVKRLGLILDQPQGFFRLTAASHSAVVQGSIAPKPLASLHFRHHGRHEKPCGNVGESCTNRLIKSPKLSREALRASFRGFSAAIIMDLVNSGLGSVRYRNSAFQSLQTASPLTPRFGNIQDASACLTVRSSLL
jgi:hypothetical protein